MSTTNLLVVAAVAVIVAVIEAALSDEAKKQLERFAKDSANRRGFPIDAKELVGFEKQADVYIVGEPVATATSVKMPIEARYTTVDDENKINFLADDSSARSDYPAALHPTDVTLRVKATIDVSGQMDQWTVSLDAKAPVTSTVGGKDISTAKEFPKLKEATVYLLAQAIQTTMNGAKHNPALERTFLPEPAAYEPDKATVMAPATRAVMKKILEFLQENDAQGKPARFTVSPELKGFNAYGMFSNFVISTTTNKLQVVAKFTTKGGATGRDAATGAWNRNVYPNPLLKPGAILQIECALALSGSTPGSLQADSSVIKKVTVGDLELYRPQETEKAMKEKYDRLLEHAVGKIAQSVQKTLRATGDPAKFLKEHGGSLS